MKTAIDPRHQARRLALATVYSKEALQITRATPLTQNIKDTLNIENFDSDLYDSIRKGVSTHHDELIKQIETHSTDWELGNIFKVDLSILLIATWELLHTKTPIKVIIDESVELAKEFGSDDSTKFINGVLAGITKDLPDRQ